MMLWCTPEEAISWAEEQNWARRMATCPQDKDYHAEGDVWTHTKLVLRQLAKHPGWVGFTQADQQLLIGGALLHDCGKPDTTTEEQGRIRARGHSRAGVKIARAILRDHGVSLSLRESIVALVQCHGWPPHIVDQASPEMEVIKTAWICRNDLLTALAWADATGRIGINSGYTDAIAIWEELAHEQNCWQTPLAAANAEAKLLAFEGKDIRFYQPHEDYRGEMVLLSGLPGAGKDTWIKEHLDADVPVISLDAIREELDVAPEDQQGPVVAAGREEVRKQLRIGTRFVFNATNVSRDMRARWIRLARDYRARIRIVYLEPALSLILERNRGRKNPVPETVILRLLNRLDVPQEIEAHAVDLHE